MLELVVRAYGQLTRLLLLLVLGTRPLTEACCFGGDIGGRRLLNFLFSTLRLLILTNLLIFRLLFVLTLRFSYY